MSGSLNQMSNFSNHSNSTRASSNSLNSSALSVHSHSHGSDYTQMSAFHNFQPALPFAHSYHQRMSLLARSSTANHSANINNLAELEEDQHSAYEHKEQHTMNMPSTPSASSMHNGGGARKAKELALFNGDVRAYNTWLACSHGREWVSYAALYGKVRAYFVETVGCSRAPQKREVVPFFACFGGSDADAAMERNGFVALWAWLREACAMVAEGGLRSLWDDRLVDLFCRREQCEARLRQSAQGTFTLRLSSRVPAGLVLSYAESVPYAPPQCRHVLLVRQSGAKYLLRGRGNKQTLSLHYIVRNFVGIQFLYGAKRGIAKEKIF